MKARDVMVKDPKTCRPGNTLAEAGRIMAESDCGALPVVDADGRVAGMITDRDICLALTIHDSPASEVRVGDAISGSVYTCAPNDELRHALKVMQIQQVRRLPVVEAGGRLVGLVSMDDVFVQAEDDVSRAAAPVTFGEAVGTMKAICRSRRLHRPCLAAH